MYYNTYTHHESLTTQFTNIQSSIVINFHLHAFIIIHINLNLDVRSFTGIYLQPHSLTFIFLRLTSIMFILHHLPWITVTDLNTPSFTLTYSHLPYLHLLSFIYFHLHSFTFIYPHLRSFTFGYFIYCQVPPSTLPSCAPLQRHVQASNRTKTFCKMIISPSLLFCKMDWNFAVVMIGCILGPRCYEKVRVSDKLRHIAHFHFHFVWFAFVCIVSQISVSHPNQQQHLSLVWGWKIHCSKTIRKTSILNSVK